MAALTSPVYAPESAQCMFCAPTRTGLPRRIVATSSIIVNGGNTNSWTDEGSRALALRNAEAYRAACAGRCVIFQLVPTQARGRGRSGAASALTQSPDPAG